MQQQVLAIIFDCDGVMFDSRQANINFYNHLLARFDLPPIKESDIPIVHTTTAEESVRHLFRGTPYEKEAQALRLGVNYSPFIRDMHMEPGLMELLRLLQHRCGLAVATNRSTTIGQVLRHFGLEAFFDIVVSSLDVKRPKPHPESLQKILAFFRIPPEQSLYVGDSHIDAETADAAGVPFIAYKNRALKADYHVTRLMDIAEIANGKCSETRSSG
jgi:HAD superfamily hydrolase (TIGR01509 family)